MYHLRNSRRQVASIIRVQILLILAVGFHFCIDMTCVRRFLQILIFTRARIGRRSISKLETNKVQAFGVAGGVLDLSSTLDDRLLAFRRIALYIFNVSRTTLNGSFQFGDFFFKLLSNFLRLSRIFCNGMIFGRFVLCCVLMCAEEVIITIWMYLQIYYF